MINSENKEEFENSETTQAHRLCKIKSVLWVMTCQCKSITYKKCATLVRDVDNEGKLDMCRGKHS